MLEGDVTLTVEGQPPRAMKAGNSSYIPANTPHSARSGPNGAKVLGTNIVEKGKSLASPAP